MWIEHCAFCLLTVWEFNSVHLQVISCSGLFLPSDCFCLQRLETADPATLLRYKAGETMDGLNYTKKCKSEHLEHLVLLKKHKKCTDLSWWKMLDQPRHEAASFKRVASCDTGCFPTVCPHSQQRWIQFPFLLLVFVITVQSTLPDNVRLLYAMWSPSYVEAANRKSTGLVWRALQCSSCPWPEPCGHMGNQWCSSHQSGFSLFS